MIHAKLKQPNFFFILIKIQQQKKTAVNHKRIQYAIPEYYKPEFAIVIFLNPW